MSEPLPFGAIRPTGWMRAQLGRDLAQGFAARLDELTEHAANDLFADRVESSSEQVGWWDAETRGNWLIGLLEMAALADDDANLRRVRELTDALLATQDEDGYLGIYTAASRYQHPPGENGELWGQNRALLLLLTRYELWGEPHVLDAVRRAVELTLRAYGDDLHGAMEVTGEETEGDLVGLFHGLMFTDVLEWLARLTGEPRYLDAAVGLYDRFCALPPGMPNDDLRLDRVLDPAVPLRGHAVHTAEHLRALGLAAHVTGRTELRQGLAAALTKIAAMTTPSGALVGDESVHGLPGPDVGYEYCTIFELLRSLVTLQRWTGPDELLDWAELAVFNAGQAARLPDGTGIGYLTCDTRGAALAGQLDPYSVGMSRFDPTLAQVHGDAEVDPWARGGRFKISATHADVAVCCNPNAMRLLPEYVAAMWQRSADHATLIAAMYGPCEVRTEVVGVPVTVAVDTAYPFRETVTVTVTPERPTSFDLQLRVPSWATGTEVEPPDGTTQETGPRWITLRRTWAAGERITLTFAAEPTTFPTTDGQHVIRRGPLRYVQPIDATMVELGPAVLPGLGDRELVPARPEAPPPPVLLEADGGLPAARFLERPGDADDPWSDPPAVLEVDGQQLVPIGAALLRRATFARRRAPVADGRPAR